MALSSSDQAAGSRGAAIAWEGDSKEVLSGFPKGVKQNLGFNLRLLQQGSEPIGYRPLQSIGRGVFELRDEDDRSWYRVVYLSRINDVIYILHCFEKKSRAMPKRDADTARRRLKAVQERLRMEKKHGRQR